MTEKIEKTSSADSTNQICYCGTFVIVLSRKRSFPPPKMKVMLIFPPGSQMTVSIAKISKNVNIMSLSNHPRSKETGNDAMK